MPSQHWQQRRMASGGPSRPWPNGGSDSQSSSPSFSGSASDAEVESPFPVGNSFDHLIDWWVRQTFCVKWSFVFVCWLILFSTPSIIWYGTLAALRSLRSHSFPPSAPLPRQHHEHYAPQFQALHLPPIPAALDPFIQRVGFALPEHIFVWTTSSPCNPNPHARMGDLADPNGTTALLEHQRLLLGPHSDVGIAAWWKQYHNAVAQVDDESQRRWAEVMGKVGIMASCQDDEVAKDILNEQRRMSDEEEGWVGVEVEGVRQAHGWRCWWERAWINEKDGWEAVVQTDPGMKMREICQDMRRVERETRAPLQEISQRALANQRRILQRVQRHADAESQRLLDQVVLPALENTCTPTAPSTWTAWLFRRQQSRSTTAACATHLLQTLSNATVLGTRSPPSWVTEPDDPTGLGLGQAAAEKFYLRSPDRVFGWPIPSGEDVLENVVWDRQVTVRDELNGLAHEFAISVVAEMSAQAMQQALASWGSMCQNEVQSRGREWVFTPLPPRHPTESITADDEDSDFTPPTLVRRLLHYLSTIPAPFTSPRLHQRPPVTPSFSMNASLANHNDDGFHDFFGLLSPSNPGEADKEASPDKRGKLGQSQRFFYNALRNGSCDFVSQRPVGVPPLRPVHVPLAVSPPGSQHLISSAWAAAQHSVWRFWNEGVDVRWKMVGADMYSAGRESVQGRRVSLDLGRGVEIGAWRGCKVRREERKG
ncbi:hypothetical protein Tdes44962_MAKER07944 [Teratosphaeria destructans]|uniref:Uncharacterized protein n=1 Tax=Teratosphaeria destructans TaxID=418781 RepID=A0A9W7SXQ8_9PEZI|nr:hypothetical protein Tdes44962_MAKER07944 [Teratosphaeria destructans]